MRGTLVGKGLKKKSFILDSQIIYKEDVEAATGGVL